jgi:hypothetical protein
MRTLAVFCMAAAAAFPQSATDAGPMRGVLLERDPEPAGGECSVRAADYHVFRFRFDARTHVDRDGQTIDVPRLRPGEQVEVVSDSVGDEPLRYARTIHVTVPVTAPLVRAPAASRPRPYTLAEERLLPKGDLAFSGVIVRLNATHLVLRTRAAGEQTILLRQDTRYLDNGALAAMAALKPTMRVFVRGGKNVYGDVEGYQVMWGDILEVR